MKTSAMTEKSVTIAVTVHGNARLRKGVLDRFSLVITITFTKRIHAARKTAQTAGASPYTFGTGHSFGKAAIFAEVRCAYSYLSVTIGSPFVARRAGR